MSFLYRTAALFREDAQHRILLACVGVSIALHAVALFAFPGLRPSARLDAARVLTAIFKPRPVLVAASVEKPVPSSQEPARKARPEKTSPVPTQPLSAPVVPHPAEMTPAPVPSSSSEVPSVQPPVSFLTPGPSAILGKAVERSPVDGLDAGLLEKYRLALIDAARRYRRYPVQALDRGWQGRVEIRLVIGANGTIKNAIIKTSSRHAILDDQALDMVKKGKRVAHIPAALSGREFTVDISVIFELQTG